ncbi:MAG: hypothetical protein ACW990_14625 [Promethearchaeota archaeon]|jgi:hypothetical protein
MTEEKPEILEQKLPINDVEDVIVAVNELAILMIKRFKDGVQFDDFVALYSSIMDDEKMKKIMFDAYNGYKNIPAQAKDIDVKEACSLAAIQLKYVPIIVETIK